MVRLQTRRPHVLKRVAFWFCRRTNDVYSSSCCFTPAWPGKTMPSVVLAMDRGPALEAKAEGGPRWADTDASPLSRQLPPARWPRRLCRQPVLGIALASPAAERDLRPCSIRRRRSSAIPERRSEGAAGTYYCAYLCMCTQRSSNSRATVKQSNNTPTLRSSQTLPTSSYHTICVPAHRTSQL